LTYLVDTLEDSDGGVRDCARASVIEMFTAPTVTDGARADLKKEMTKKGVRKGIVDGVLGQLLTSGNVLVADTPMEEAPPASTSSLFSGRRPISTSFVSTSASSRTISMNDHAPGTPTEETEAVVLPVYVSLPFALQIHAVLTS
jgi:CLIP-associating protein 1/2